MRSSIYDIRHPDYRDCLVVAANNYGRKMLPSSFNYVVLVVRQDPGWAEMANDIVTNNNNALRLINFFIVGHP